MISEADVNVLSFYTKSALEASTLDGKDHYLLLIKSVLSSPMIRCGGELGRPENPTSALRDRRASEVKA
jgi:hypothetical protein